MPWNAEFENELMATCNILATTVTDAVIWESFRCCQSGLSRSLHPPKKSLCMETKLVCRKVNVAACGCESFQSMSRLTMAAIRLSNRYSLVRLKCCHGELVDNSTTNSSSTTNTSIAIDPPTSLYSNRHA
jgi:hypothetical protein